MFYILLRQTILVRVFPKLIH